MANYPKKMKDPTEAALSAIQEALNIRDEDNAQAAPQPSASAEPLEAPEETFHPSEPEPPAFNDDFDDVGSRGTRTLRAANDDQQSIGQILQMLQRRPPRTSYFAAAVFSAVWIVGCLALSASAPRRCCRSCSSSASPTWRGAPRNCA
jgi:hypothetical protein